MLTLKIFFFRKSLIWLSPSVRITSYTPFAVIFAKKKKKSNTKWFLLFTHKKRAHISSGLVCGGRFPVSVGASDIMSSHCFSGGGWKTGALVSIFLPKDILNIFGDYNFHHPLEEIYWVRLLWKELFNDDNRNINPILKVCVPYVDLVADFSQSSVV